MTVTLNPDPQVAVRPLTKTEKVMSRAMLAAWSAPQFNIVVDIDMQHALGQRRPGVTVTDIILSACAKALIQVPAMNGADGLSLDGIAERRKALVEKVRTGSISVSEVVGGTFTVSNLGMFDVRQFTAILNPPQVGILAVGSTRTIQVWNDGAPEWRPISAFSLTCDHRAVDGALAARFLGVVKDILEGCTT